MIKISDGHQIRIIKYLEKQKDKEQIQSNIMYVLQTDHARLSKFLDDLKYQGVLDYKEFFAESSKRLIFKIWKIINSEYEFL